MAKERGLVDQGLEGYQNWNKLELAAEGTAIAVGYFLGVPGLIALGAAGAAVNGVQMMGIHMIQQWRERTSGKGGGGVIERVKKVFLPRKAQVFPSPA